MRKNVKKDGVSPVIAVILMVAITVVLAGVLYVWVTSLADTEEGTENLRLNAQDAANVPALAETTQFTTTDDFLKIEQTGGDPIDWSVLTILCEVTGTGNRIKLNVYSIAGDTAETQSSTGEIIILRVAANGDFSSGDYVDITITKGDAKVYTQKSIRVV
jgi:flagellin-like protein